MNVFPPMISRDHSTSVSFVHLADFLLHLCFSGKFCKVLQKILNDMGNFCIGMAVYSLFLVFNGTFRFQDAFYF